jgi:hypothetical protein
MAIPRLTKKEALVLAKGPLSGEVLKLAASYVQPIFWLTGPVGTGLMRNGTTFFLDAGRGVFGVTAGHVLDAYRRHMGGNPGVCHVGMQGLTLDLEKRLIGRGRTVDIATYRIESGEVGRLGATIRREPSWPPQRPRSDRSVFYAGYPGQERKLVGERRIEWGLYGAAGTSTAVNEDSIVCQMERENAVQTLGVPIPEVGYDVGGLSGAPLFAFWESTMVYWKLAGVIYEGGGEMFEHVRAAHADRIKADGTIED